MCSSLDGSVYSEDGGGVGVAMVGGGGATGAASDECGEDEEQEIQFQLSEYIDQLGDKRSVCHVSVVRM